MNKTPKKFCRDGVAVFLIILLSILLFGQTRAEGDEGVLGTAKQWLRTRITYSCTESPIETVLMELAEQAEIDIVKSPQVTGNVTVKVTNVPLEEALTNILAAHNYTYIATENMVRVIPLPPASEHKEQQVTRIYRITYADAHEVVAALKTFISGKGEIGLSKGTSHIIVTDTESKIKAIDKFIDQIDHITSQVLVEVRVYDITSNEGFELSPDWFVGRNAPYTADTILPPSEITTTETGPSDHWEERTDDIDGYEGGFPRESDDTRREDSWTGPTTETETTYINPQPIMTDFRRKPFVGGSFDRITGGSLRFSLLNDAVDIDLALSILQTQVEAKLLANPRILVLDNETANFEIIREIPYRELLQVAREDPITYTEFKNVGVGLKVTPHIARDGMIRLHIVPEFGVLVSQDAIGVQAGIVRNALDIPTIDNRMVLGVPTVDTRRVDTTALIRDGQTIVLGGLRQKETTKDISKVPVLGDMPLVGGLFRSETESVETRELVVFITTRIVTEPVLSEIEEKQLSATQFAPPKFTETKLEGKKLAKRDKQPKIEVDKVDVDIDAGEPDTDVTEITRILDRLLEKTSVER